MNSDHDGKSGLDKLPTIVGRSSSHFTRLTRIVAAELAVPYSFRVVEDLLDRDQATYCSNPALKIPVLLLNSEHYFGSLNICRQLSELSPDITIRWPEDLVEVEDRNAFELVWQAMSTEVSQIMAGRGGVKPTSPYSAKLQASLDGSLRWLEMYMGRRGTDVQFDIQFLDMALYCLVSHLVFRETIDLSRFPRLRSFVDAASSRASVRATAYRYD